MEEITRVSVEVLGGTPEMVDILITDVKREKLGHGRQALAGTDILSLL